MTEDFNLGRCIAPSALNSLPTTYVDSITSAKSALTGLSVTTPSYLDSITAFKSTLAGLSVTTPSYFDGITSAKSAFADLNVVMPSYLDNITAAKSALTGLSITMPSYLDSMNAAKSALAGIVTTPSYLDSIIASMRPDFGNTGSVTLGVTTNAPTTSRLLTSFGAPHEQEALAINAFVELRAVENEVRSIVALAMVSAFGDTWLESRAPSRLLRKLGVRRECAVLDGETEAPLLHYADFGDYIDLLSHNDNWDVVFSAIFDDYDGVISALRRLNIVRRPTMHSREISDELLRILSSGVSELRRAIVFYRH
jgi:hypothetical protein